jgi:uncharacterized protein (DUF885 family)
MKSPLKIISRPIRTARLSWLMAVMAAFALGGSGCTSQDSGKQTSAQGQPVEKTTTASPAATAGKTEKPEKESPPRTEAQKARQVYHWYDEQQLKLNPLSATFRGDHRYDDQLPNFLGAEWRAKARKLEEDALKRISKVDRKALPHSEQTSYDLFIAQRKNALEGFQYPDHLMPINQFYSLPNMFAMLGSGTQAQPFKTVADYRNWLKRMDSGVVLLDQAIANMKEGQAKGYSQPKVLMQRVLPQLQALLVDKVEDSLFWQPVKNMPDSFSDSEKAELTRAYREKISQQVLPAYQRLYDYIKNDYLPKARETYGLYDVPHGKDWYAYKVRTITTTDYTPEQIHEIGKQEVARIQQQMKDIMRRVGFKGSLKDFFEYTKNDPKFHFSSQQELLQAYADLKDKINARVPEIFSIFPKADFEIRPVEAFREKSAAGASYQSASADGSRPGVFYVNTYDLSARPKWGVENLYLHEAVPGHHFQLSIQQELPGLPNFRKFGGYTAYVEGWALYSEGLGKELGVYQDPYSEFGQLSAELWRAIRLVVDTGIHQFGWSRDKVLDYMYANAPVVEARAVSEAERFMAIPGQALAYKIGQMKIRQLRDQTEAELGHDKSVVRGFHTQVLNEGAVPLDYLEKKIGRWIERQKAERAEQGQKAGQGEKATGGAKN